jgi:hypothetical protein
MNAERRSIERRFVFCDALKKISKNFFGTVQTTELGWQLGELHTIRFYRRAMRRER